MKKPDVVKTTFETYTIQDQIGQGGAGYVYSAISESGNVFALKFLDPEKATKEKRKRFKNEYGFCSKNKHPNIITVIDSGLHEDETPFFVMPIYDSSIRPLIGKVDEAKAIQLISKILNGVETAHLKGIIHRDLKPENILIRGEGSELVIADFGIARFTTEDLYTAIETKADTRLANFIYAAPEQKARGGEITFATDVFALGLIINEIFTGQVIQGTGYKTIGEAFKGMSYFDPIIDKMINQDPDQRFASIDEIKQEIQMREQEWVTRQKISQLENKVIPISEIDDPLINDPIKIMDKDWIDGTLEAV